MKYSVHMLEIRFYPEEIGLGFCGIQLVVFISPVCAKSCVILVRLTVFGL